jgi:hypothetical protein
VIRTEPKKIQRKEAGVSAQPQSDVEVDRRVSAPQREIALAHAVPQKQETLAGDPDASQLLTEAPRQADVDVLLQQAEAFIAQHEIMRARICYLIAANLGSAKGAMGAGQTYDPEFLSKTDADGIQPDQALATRWYSAALDMMRRATEARLHQFHSS